MSRAAAKSLTASRSRALQGRVRVPGETTVVEPVATGDHTERMLRHFGATVTSVMRDGAAHITVTGHAELNGRAVTVPADPSSAAFIVAAAVLVPGSEVTAEGVLVNPTRTGLYVTLQAMGADIAFLNERKQGGEPVADIRARHGRLKGVRVPPERAASMIDDYPILAVIAAFADGETRMEGLAELKSKGSDRLAASAVGLAANGIAHAVEGEALTVMGATSVRGDGIPDPRPRQRPPRHRG